MEYKTHELSNGVEEAAVFNPTEVYSNGSI